LSGFIELAIDALPNLEQTTNAIAASPSSRPAKVQKESLRSLLSKDEKAADKMHQVPNTNPKPKPTKILAFLVLSA